MRFNKLICISIIVGLASGCVNYQAVGDFGTGTGTVRGLV